MISQTEPHPTAVQQTTGNLGDYNVANTLRNLAVLRYEINPDPALRAQCHNDVLTHLTALSIFFEHECNNTSNSTCKKHCKKMGRLFRQRHNKLARKPTVPGSQTLFWVKIDKAVRGFHVFVDRKGYECISIVGLELFSKQEELRKSPELSISNVYEDFACYANHRNEKCLEAGSTTDEFKLGLGKAS